MIYHCSQSATAIRGEQWLDALNYYYTTLSRKIRITKLSQYLLILNHQCKLRFGKF